ncbi:MAG: ADOP family duplicated permease [Gemmatimonadota bacterium]
MTGSRPARLYRRLLGIYPEGFRQRYSDEMADAFACLHRRVARDEGLPGLAWLWLRTVLDVLLSGARERLGVRRAATSNDQGMTMTKKMMFHLRQAVRSLRRTPGYGAAFTLTLGLAIGVNSAVFSVVDGVLLDPLPFKDGDRILYLKQPVVRAGVDNTTFSFIEIDDYRAAATTVDEFVEFGDWKFSVVGEGEAHRAVAGLVTSNYFDVLGMQSVLGRTLEPEDDVPGAEAVMVLTDEYWTRAFGGDREVVGRIVELTGVRTRIVGVLEPGMHYTGSRRQDFYANYSTNDHYQGAAMRDSRRHRMTDVFARLAPGADLESARAELGAIAARLHEEHPEAYPAELGFGLEVVPWREELTRRARPTFLLLMGTVATVLLLACANVANLTLTRLIRKERELATRGALGASGLDLRLHLTAENVVLAVTGAAIGLALAVVSRGALVSYASRFTVRAQEVGVDWSVLGATLLGGLAAAVVLAWLPGLPVNPGPAGVATSASRATHGRGRRRVQRGLVIGQLALSFTLLAGAGLLVRSLLNLYAVDPGFRTEDVLTLEAARGNFASQQHDDALFRELLHRVRAFPGVRAAAVARWAPLTGQNPVAWYVRVDGGSESGDRSHLTSINLVSPGYADVLGLRLEAGRFIEHGDDADADSVIVINRSMAEAHFGAEDPVGRRLGWSFDGEHWSSYAVVGVVSDSHEYGIGRSGVHTVYRPADQASWGPTVLVATRGDPLALADRVRQIVRELDPTLPVDQVQTLEDLRASDVAPSRLNAALFGAFALLALLIAAVGVLGVLAFSVSQRVREFGVRMALGADRVSVLRSVLREGLLLVGVALALGAAGSLLLGRLLSDLLFGVEPIDPISLAWAGAVLGLVAIGAALHPALRATRVDPARALAAE